MQLCFAYAKKFNLTVFENYSSRYYCQVKS